MTQFICVYANFLLILRSQILQDNMENNHVKELNKNTLYRFLLRNNGCRIYWQAQNGDETYASFTSNSNSVYFNWSNGTYRRVDLSTASSRDFNSKGLLADMLKIKRIEKQFEEKWLPVWTSVDGFIESDFLHFAYIQGKYYTFKELDHLISEVKTLKRVVAKLNV